MLLHTYLLLSLIGLTFGWFSPMLMISEHSMIAHLLTHVCITGSILSTIFNINHVLFQCIFNVLCGLVIGLTRGHNVQQDAHANLLTNALMSLGATAIYLNSINNYMKNKAVSLTSTALSGFNLSNINNVDYKILIIICLIVMLFKIFLGKRFFTYVLQPELSSYYHSYQYQLVWISFNVVMSLLITTARYIMGPVMCLPILIGPGAIALQWQGKLSKITYLSIAISLITMNLSIFLPQYIPLTMSSVINFTLLCMYYVSPLYFFIKKSFLKCYKIN